MKKIHKRSLILTISNHSQWFMFCSLVHNRTFLTFVCIYHCYFCGIMLMYVDVKKTYLILQFSFIIIYLSWTHFFAYEMHFVEILQTPWNHTV